MRPSIISRCIAAAVLAFGLVTASSVAPKAATQNYSVAIPGVVVVPLQLSGQYTATEVAVVRFALPFKARLVGASASARASGGTSPTLTVDVQDDAASVLSAPVAVTAGAVAEAVITAAAIADESVITIDLAITGTSPTWDDITILLTFVRT